MIWYPGGARLITDQQVVLLRRKLMEGKTQQGAAASAAMSERSARKWQRGSLPSERKKEGRSWRTRPDPFADFWESEVVPLLRSDPDGELSATTILEWLDERHPGRFGSSQLRTLQRRIRDHRALHGPDREVYFQQDHPPGREAQVDFTHCGELGVTIGGEPFRHLLFQFVLSHSGWSYAEVCFGETFAALAKGLQGALWELGGVPRVVRTDNLSAATHELRDSRGRAMNVRYEAVLAHYGVESTRTNRRSSHENGVVEQRHRRVKNAIAQALILRGSRDFESEEEYRGFVRRVVDRRNRLVRSKLRAERRHLRPLPPSPVPEYANYRARVRRWSTIRVANRTYSVPSRLIGMEVDVRLYADHIEVHYKGHLVESMERVHGTGEAQIDYRHIIGSLVRKPGAFARYRFREQMFPTQTFRLAYDALCGWRGERADVEYVRILHLAATTMESKVDRTLRRLLESGLSFDYAQVRRLSAPDPPPVPELKLPGKVDLGVYDRLLVGGAR
ncbi:MAG: IS21 family transposase [Aphanocapsa feldmannii 288cV]|nr:MAG: IS21 family transposase [Aphanocapsa feldmannii 288cV]